MASPGQKQQPIAIIGAGCWGLSTAYHLQSAGFEDITIFDRSAEIPSPYSAGNDLNKIVRAQYDDDFYTELGLVSIPNFLGGQNLTQTCAGGSRCLEDS